MRALCLPFDETVWWEAVLDEGSVEDIEGGAVDAFIFVVTNDAKQTTNNSLEDEEGCDGDIIDGFSFVICGNVWGKGVYCFQSINYIFTCRELDESFEAAQEFNGSTIV